MIENLSEEELSKLLKQSEDIIASHKESINGSALESRSVEAAVLKKDSLEPKDDSELSAALQPQDRYNPIPFKDPIELLYFADPQIASGVTKLHEWQIETLLLLSSDKFTFEERLKFILTAANGSGKDCFIIAALAVWQLCSRVRSRFIASSASQQQIMSQTQPHILSLVNKMDIRLRRENYSEKPFIVRTKPFHIVSTFSGAEIIAFVTDDPANCEGYHPWEAGRDVTIVVNEAKSVPDEFIDAFSRCTYNRWLEISSPGRTTGRNYEHYTASVKYPAPYEKGKFYSRRVTSYDCPHKSAAIIEEDKIAYGGEDSELFRSKHLALYTSIGENTILNLDIIDKYCGLEMPRWDGRNEVRGGLDLSLGGDETVLAKRRGNELTHLEFTRIKNTVLLESYLEKLFYKLGFTKTDLIFTDIGGLGKPIYQHLVDKGWKLIPFLFGNPAIGFDQMLYANRGSEVWYEFANYFNRGLIKLLKDDILREQLGSRKYQRPNNDKIRLQPKAEILKDKDRQQLSNHKKWFSPDRADATVMSFSDFQPADILLGREKKNKENGNLLKRVTQDKLVEVMSKNRFAGYDKPSSLVVSRITQDSLIREQIKHFNSPKG